MNLPAIRKHVGDPAPALAFGEWLKGPEIKSFEKGRVYVVDFWATWCGWCKSGMPHYSELAKKYAGRVTFLAIDSMEHGPGGVYPYDKVESFVKNAHDVMDFCVAADTKDEAMRKAWMDDFGGSLEGIPHSFIVDENGNVAWHGYPPAGLDEALALVLDHKLDEAQIARIQETGERRVATANTWIAAMNEALKTPSDPAMMKLAVYAADQAMRQGPVWNFEAVPGKYMALLAGDPAAAAAYARKAAADPANGPYALVPLALKIVDKDNPHPDGALAKEVLDVAMRNSDPTDASLFQTRALVCFKAGDAAQAAALQKSYVEGLKATAATVPEAVRAKYLSDRVGPAEAVLKEYEAGAGSQAGT
jgi:thiol-disulfide isomerase/thioredoxin